MELSPVLLFTYKRLDATKQTVEALRRNYLADRSELFVFSDGPANESDGPKVQAVRNYLRTVTGFRKITLYEADRNKGLAGSIVDGVSWLINEYDQVIVLEDDLLTSRNFLSFCNQALSYYHSHRQVFSIGGYTRPILGLDYDEVYFTRRATSWGWATWKERWNEVDWKVSTYDIFAADRKARKSFNEMGSDMSAMLDKQMRGEIDSWAIRWCYHQFTRNYLTVFPARSKVENIGFTEGASHTKGRFNGFKTELDETDNISFGFSRNFVLDKRIIHQFTKPFSISERIKNKLLNIIYP
jgi:hypothetical protein